MEQLDYLFVLRHGRSCWFYCWWRDALSDDADVVEDSEVQTNRRSEGLFYAARSFAGKAVSALGIILIGSIVSLVGMDGIKSVVDMTDEMRVELASFFLPLYCGLYLVAIYLISCYKIDRDTHNQNLEALSKQ